MTSKLIQPLTFIVSMIVGLITPLQWCFPVIPLISSKLIYLLESPTPYIFGVLDHVDYSILEEVKEYQDKIESKYYIH